MLERGRIVDHRLQLDGDELTIESPTGKALQGYSGNLFTINLPTSYASGEVVLRDIEIVTPYGATIAQDNDTICVNYKRRNTDISDVNDIINQMLGCGKTGTFGLENAAFKMVYVEGGTFMMGNDNVTEYTEYYDDILAPRHQVTVSDFIIATTEVTNRLWDAVMGTESNVNYLTCPVTGKNWYEWQDFIKRLSEQTGFEFRMPTEAEWNFAARGGNLSHDYAYSGSNNDGEVGGVVQTRDLAQPLRLILLLARNPTNSGCMT